MIANQGEIEGRQLLKPETARLAIPPHTHRVYTESQLRSRSRLYGLHIYSWTDRFGINPAPFRAGVQFNFGVHRRFFPVG